MPNQQGDREKWWLGSEWICCPGLLWVWIQYQNQLHHQWANVEVSRSWRQFCGLLLSQGERRVYRQQLLWPSGQFLDEFAATGPVSWHKGVARAILRQHAFRSSCPARERTASEVLDARRATADIVARYLICHHRKWGNPSHVGLHHHRMRSRPHASAGELRSFCPSWLELPAEVHSHSHLHPDERWWHRISSWPIAWTDHEHEATLHPQALRSRGLSERRVHLLKHPAIDLDHHTRREQSKLKRTWFGSPRKADGTGLKLWQENSRIYNRIIMKLEIQSLIKV